MTLPDLSALTGVLGRTQPSPVRRRLPLPRAPKQMPSIPLPETSSQEPSLLKRAINLGAWTVVAGGVEQAASGAVRLVTPIVTNLVSPSSVEQNATQEVANASLPILKTISTTAQGAAQGVGSVAGTVLEGTKGLASDFKSMWSWGSWGFRLLPAKMQVALGLTAAIGGFILIRSFRSNSSTHHYHHNTSINVNGMPPQCRLVTKKIGNDTEISFDCTEPAAITGKDIPNRVLLRRLHERLTNAKKVPLLLPEELRARVISMVKQLDKAKTTYYRSINISLCIEEAKEIDTEVTSNMQSHIKKIIEIWKSKIK